MTNQTLIEAKLQRTLTTAEVSSLAVLIPVVEQFIASWTNRNFVDAPAENEEIAETVKYYDGNGCQELAIDDAQEVTKVESYDPIDEVGTEIDSDRYTTYPHNVLPIRSIRFLYDDIFSPGVKNIKITAKWGSSSGIPADIQGIATHLAAELLSNPSQVKQESIEGYSRVLYDLLPPIYQAALDSRVKVMI
jgi:hypothetical protein